MEFSKIRKIFSEGSGGVRGAVGAIQIPNQFSAEGFIKPDTENAPEIEAMVMREFRRRLLDSC